MMTNRNRNLFRSIGLVSAISSQLVGSILLGIFIGIKLDRWLNIEPLFLIVCLLLGLAAGVIAMLSTIKKYSGEE